MKLQFLDQVSRERLEVPMGVQPLFFHSWRAYRAMVAFESWQAGKNRETLQYGFDTASSGNERNLSEGGISPYLGRNICGATATFNSVCKVDQVKLRAGSILNMRVAPEAVKDERGIQNMTALLRTFTEHGGNLVQFNFADNATLKAAQQEPDNYKDLLVRVATYSAFFVELGTEVQNDIITRNELV